MNVREARIVKLISAKPRTFEELVRDAWGVYPSELETILSDLERSGVLRKTTAGQWHTGQGAIAGQQAPSWDFPRGRRLQRIRRDVRRFVATLPLPHPRDYDWRFSINGIEAFVQHMLKYYSPGDEVLLIAAPTVYVYLRALACFERLSLIERSADTVAAIRSVFGESAGVHTHDLQQPWPLHLRSEVSCVLMDPPWYQDYFELFFSRVVELMSLAGFVHTALFPAFTRDTALREREAIFTFAQSHGLSLVEVSQGALEYESPPFENRSLVEKGQRIAATWRRGDIATFFVGQQFGRQTVANVDSGTWREFRVGTSKIVLRIEGESTYEAPALSTVEPDSPYLSTVSRRYPKRNDIGLWSSCQQAYSVRGAHVIETLLRHIVEGGTLASAVRELASEYGQDEARVGAECAQSFACLRSIVDREKEHASKELRSAD